MAFRRSAFPSKFNQNVISNHSVLRSISCRISFQEAHFLPSSAQSLLSYSAIPSKFSAFPPHKTSETLICTRFSMAVNKAIINKKINKALSGARVKTWTLRENNREFQCAFTPNFHLLRVCGLFGIYCLRLSYWTATQFANRRHTKNHQTPRYGCRIWCQSTALGTMP